MQQHRRKRNRGKHPMANANGALPESCRIAIRELLGAIDGQEDFASCYLRREYLSKFLAEDLVPSGVRRKAAIDKWIATEEKNRTTNLRLRGLDRGYNILPRVTWYTFLRFVQDLTSRILGPLTDELVVGSFSGGASTSRRRTESLPAQKFSGMADVTPAAAPYVGVIHREAPLLRQYHVFDYFREVDGAVLFTVPKKTDIDRCACKEPDINMFLQKGVGAHIRRRLLKFGVNLQDQSINRKFAQKGSLDGSLATLDLSSASDSMTISCVRAILPEDWYLYLNDIRSPIVMVDGEAFRTEMFSSMGNGFTFELESLIFYVLMRAVSYFEGIQGVVSVYGDDIIIPTGMYDLGLFVLSVFGFTPNYDKSFAEGPFRESCGGHYHNGNDVTPFYLKRDATRITDAIRVANQLRRWALADPSRAYSMPSLYKSWELIASYVPKDLWGGRDLSRDDQLVSPHPSNKRLVRVQRKVSVPPLGRYCEWHNANWNRRIDPEGGHEPLRADTVCRTRPAIPGAPYLAEEFWEELFGKPVPT